jgi:hypothetical protein
MPSEVAPHPERAGRGEPGTRDRSAGTIPELVEQERQRGQGRQGDTRIVADERAERRGSLRQLRCRRPRRRASPYPRCAASSVRRAPPAAPGSSRARRCRARVHGHAAQARGSAKRSAMTSARACSPRRGRLADQRRFASSSSRTRTAASRARAGRPQSVQGCHKADDGAACTAGVGGIFTGPYEPSSSSTTLRAESFFPIM